MNKQYLRNSLIRQKESYYQWRYWYTLIKDMKKNIKKERKLPNENGLLRYINKPGIAFSFDDSFRVEHWYNYAKDIFGYYDVQVTFNINAFHHFENQREHNQKEIDLLLELQANGHEIAHHGFKHRNALEYSRSFGLDHWIKNDIHSLITWVDEQRHSRTKNKFRKIVTYAFPYAEYNTEVINGLVPKYFKIVRGHINKGNMVPFEHTGFAPSIGIDSVYLKDTRYIKRVLELAKENESNLIFMCHSILPEEINWASFGWEKDLEGVGWWRVSPDVLQTIITMAKEMDLEFYTTAELAGVASFIDPNFEECVRKIISNPFSKWIKIPELIHIKELDLSNQQISNLDGIQYFLNLERVNLTNNNITDFRLLDKLSKLEEVIIDNRVIKEKQLLQ